MTGRSIKYIKGHTHKAGCAQPIWKSAQVGGLNESRLTLRRDEDKDRVASEVVTTRNTVPTALLVRVQCLRKGLDKGV